jgi:hypothetical protein
MVNIMENGRIELLGKYATAMARNTTKGKLVAGRKHGTVIMAFHMK